MMDDLEAFAREWIDAFNAHDLDRILAHYSDDVRLYSPRVKQVMGDPSGCVRGKGALRDYFAAGLARTPELRFSLGGVYPGAGSVVFRLHTNEGREGSELMVFAPDGRVSEVRAHWTAI
jgi:hypothetical protein